MKLFVTLGKVTPGQLQDVYGEAIYKRIANSVARPQNLLQRKDTDRYIESQCGIVGFFSKNGDGQAETGRTILGMLRALGCRGLDSAGVALYGAPSDKGFAVRDPATTLRFD